MIDQVCLGCTQRGSKAKALNVKIQERSVCQDHNDRQGSFVKIQGHRQSESCVVKFRHAGPCRKNAWNDVVNWHTHPWISGQKFRHLSRRYQIAKDDIETVWVKFVEVCAQIVFKFLHHARIGSRPDRLWTVDTLARTVTKWTRACDKMLARLTSCLQCTSDHRQFCHVGDQASAGYHRKFRSHTTRSVNME